MAQLGTIEDFINQGYDAIVTIAVSPEGFDRVIRLADRNGVVMVPFDNILDTDAVMMVNEDQYAMGVMSGEFLVKELGDVKAARCSRCAGCRAIWSTATAIWIPGGDGEEGAGLRSWRSSATGMTAPRRRRRPTRCRPRPVRRRVHQGGSTGLVRAFLMPAIR